MLASKQKDIFLAFLSVLIFALFVLFLPVYDVENGLHNIFFDNYNLTWHDGRSPINFYIIKNLINGKSLFFPADFVFRDVPAKNNYDFFEYNGMYYPDFNYRPAFLFSLILKPFHFDSDLALFKAILSLVTIFFASSLFIFYFVQRNFGLKTNFAFFSTLTGGLATSVFIYSHYLFLVDSIIAFFFFLFLFFVSKYWNKNSKIASYFIPISFSAFFLLFVNSGIVFLIFLVIILYFLYFKNKSFKSLKTFLIIVFIGLLINRYLVFFEYPLPFSISYFFVISIPIFFLFIAIILYFIYFENRSIKSLRIFLLIIGVLYLFLAFYIPASFNFGSNNISINEGWNSISGFKLFSNYITADDFEIYGYHIASDLKDRTFSYIYGFAQFPGNAIFVHSIGFFGSLFSEKGFVYNSPFLIFSILGAFYYKDKQKRNFISVIILTYVILVSASFAWYGGVTPRYVRNFDIPILLLTFFGFYFIQENKNKLITLLFVILILLSILNVVSLAVRADWTYEQRGQLISYDLILWPFSTANNIKSTTNIST